MSSPSLFLCLRMRAVIDLDHLFHRDLRVDLRRREPRVAEEFLNVAQVGAAVQQMRRERMPERVRRDVVNIGTLLYVFIDHSTDRTRRYPRALVI